MTTLTQKTTRVTEAQDNLIDQFKDHTNIDAIVKAFAQQSQDLENAAFEVLLETTLADAIGIQLDNLGTIVGVERGGRNDADYRVRIGAQILLNTASGTIEELLALAVALGATTDVLLREVQPAKIEIEVDIPITNGAEIGAVMGQAKAGGVGFSFTWYESATPFKFDTSGQGFDQGEFGEMITI
jgi:alpha-D-ribose 1-methylphosphonate 5-triphosphate synthase subunit PhnG